MPLGLLTTSPANYDASWLNWLKVNWKITYLLATIIAVVLIYVSFKFLNLLPHKSKMNAQWAASVWGIVLFSIFFICILGASSNLKQFLAIFSCGCIGGGLGYLTGIWLSPLSSSEQKNFQKAQTVATSLLAGAFGTKLLTLWDDITKDINGSKLIFNSDLYLPLLIGVASYFIALTAFYTLRQSGDVRITAPKSLFVLWTDKTTDKTYQNGIRSGTTIQFAGAADFPDDISVIWSLVPKAPRAVVLPAPSPPNSPTIQATSGLLTAPDHDWVLANQSALDWVVIATSNRDRSMSARYRVHFL